MISNIEKYKKDLNDLITKGENLLHGMQYECNPDSFKESVLKILKDEKKTQEFLDKLPNFTRTYQGWYSESLVLIKLLIPDRLKDFVRLYEKPKNRKAIEHGSYVIEDYLQDLSVTNSWGERKVGPEAAIPQFHQQLNILKSIQRRFESSLFDIKQLVQADLFNSELDSAKELIKNKFVRAAGGVAGVVLEKHLAQVCDNHNIKIVKRNPTINDLNELLKQNNIVDTAQWRLIQHLGDLRNLCDHNKKKEPTAEEGTDLIDGVEKITKTIF